MRPLPPSQRRNIRSTGVWNQLRTGSETFYLKRIVRIAAKRLFLSPEKSVEIASFSSSSWDTFFCPILRRRLLIVTQGAFFALRYGIRRSNSAQSKSSFLIIPYTSLYPVGTFRQGQKQYIGDSGATLQYLRRGGGGRRRLVRVQTVLFLLLLLFFSRILLRILSPSSPPCPIPLLPPPKVTAAVQFLAVQAREERERGRGPVIFLAPTLWIPLKK